MTTDALSHLLRMPRRILTASFWVALAVLIAGLILVAATLPARPRPRAEDLGPGDVIE